MKLSKHFNQSEFQCRHCGQVHPENPTPPAQVLNWLEDIREHFGQPVHINSGYRCPTHNKNVGGATSSYHMKGQAADLWIDGVDPSKVADYAEEIIGDKGGVGRYSSFTHIDNRGFKARWGH